MAAGKGWKVWLAALTRVGRPFLSEAESARVVAAIREEEAKTSGEIAVHIVAQCKEDDLLAKARALMKELGLDRTKERNAVLILVSELDRRFAVWGDEGIHAKAGQALWDRAAAALAGNFKEGRYGEGLEAAVHEAGAELARLFPRTGDGPDVNELSDDITRS